jgi:hypothetical protein
MIRIAAFFFLAAAVWIPLLRWNRMSQTWRYVAFAALGAAIVFYMQHPTTTPCERDVAACGSGL